jgi:tetratricopeptide (TPR) repeat protein
MTSVLVLLLCGQEKAEQIAALLGYKECEQLERGVAAGECFERWAGRFPKDRLADEALYNAFVSLSAVDAVRAVDVAQALAKKYPDSRLLPVALFKASMLLEQLGRAKEQAELCEQVALRWPDSREGVEALYNAAVLRTKLGDCRKAHAHAKALKRVAKKGSDEAKTADRVLTQCP